MITPARHTAMKFFMKDPDKKNAIMYGIGHGGIEAILVTGLNMISNLVTSMMINAGSLESILAPLGDERQTLLTQLSALWTEPSWKFYMAGMERVSAVMLHIVLSYLVYMAVKNQKIIWYVLSVLLHAAVNAGTILFAQVLPVWIVEVILLAVCAGLIFAVKRQYQKEPA